MMEQAIAIFNDYAMYIVASLGALVLILLICVCMTQSKLKKLQRRFETFMGGDELDLEGLLGRYTNDINALLESEKEVRAEMKSVNEKLNYCIQKVGIVRYKAIANTGADLSFAIALLDHQNDGIVLNGIYSRDGSYTYAKPIRNGKSTYNLSDEEIEAIEQALKSK
nr:DUF4446 family protein [uncultured Cellulosilyticum sp.]